MPAAAIALLLLSAAVALVRSHYQVLGVDEYGFGLLDFDRDSSLFRLLHVQLTTPLLLDPIGYNVLEYALIQLFGKGALVLRLPAIAGYLGMQACLFYFVRRIADERAATVALAIPALAGTVVYSVVSRPYGLWLGLSALAILCWQTAARHHPRRAAALVGLALSLVAMVNTQYYAVLLFVPLFAGEAVRSLEKKAVDLPVLASLLIGMSGLLIGLPFVKATAPFRAFHTKLGNPSLHFITHAYLWLVVGFAALSVRAQHLIGLSVALLLLALAAGFVRLRSRVALRLPYAELVFLLLLSAFPVLGYLLALAATHFVEGRYIQPAVIGLAALLAILAAPLLRGRTVGRVVPWLLFFAIAGIGVATIRSERNRSQRMLASLIPDPATQAILDRFRGRPVYCVNHFQFEFIHYYSPSPELRSRVTLVAPRPSDFPNGPGADVSRQTANMVVDGLPNVVTYAAASKPGTENLFLFPGYPGDWSVRALADSHARIEPVGEILASMLASVRFPPAAEAKPGDAAAAPGNPPPPKPAGR
ncbi:MAG: glycosyltransferase family 39 protein [Acidobacteriaceae bacterium]